MKNIINYVKEEKRSFKEFPFNDVDSLVLSAFSYFDFKEDVPGLFSVGKIKIKDLDVNKFKKYSEGLTDRKRFLQLLNEIVKSPRFMDMELDNYYEKESIEEEMGFKAFTIENDDFIYVSFMGTRTASIISWKEDFNLAYLSPLPSQKLALRYLNKVMFESFKPVYVGGHSKGGNHAIYSSMHTNFFNKLRIRKIYSHDGPGFLEDVINSRKFKSIENKISKTIPQGSIIGMLLYTKEDVKIIKSSGISGVDQHSPFNWHIKNSDFIYLKDLSWAAKNADKVITDLVNGLTRKQKIKFIDSFFSILQSNNFNPLDIPNRNYVRMYSAFRKGLKEIDEESREIIIDVFKKIIQYEKDYLLNNSND